MTPTINSLNKAFKNLDRENLSKVIEANTYPHIEVRIVESNESGKRLILPWQINSEYRGTAEELFEYMAQKVGSDLGRLVDLGDTECSDPFLHVIDGIRKKHSLTSMSEVKRVCTNYEVVVSDLKFKANRQKTKEIYMQLR